MAHMRKLEQTNQEPSKKRFLATSQQHGFSLLEVLVSIVVLSVGLLGLAALQMNSVQYNHGAFLRSIAVSQVNDIIDRMRANQTAVDAGNYNALSGVGSAPSCSACTPEEIVQKDLFEWNANNALLLPTGQGTVTAAGNLFNISVMWDNSRNGATGTNCSGDLSVDLTCLTVSVQL